MTAINRPAARWMREDINIFRSSVRKLIEREFEPHYARWAEQGIVDREAWQLAGDAGLLCVSMPEEYGGGGGTFAHEAVIAEELEYSGIGIGFSIGLHNAIIAPYYLAYGTEEQRRRWLPKLASGEYIAAIAMTEPGTGSDLQGVRTTARKQDDGYSITGQKVFITNGQLADLILTVCKTDPSQGAKGISLIAVEAERQGFRRGRNLDKIGLEASDTSELFYDDVHVPAENLLGGVEGRGFYQLMEKLAQERLLLAISAAAAMERAIEITSAYVKERRAFGQAIMDFQNTQFRLAECKTEATIARVFIDDCIERHMDRKLDAASASMAKWWCSQKQCEIVDTCLQFFGGYGYMSEYPISQMYKDARVQRIYGGTNEVMKLLIARTL